MICILKRNSNLNVLQGCSSRLCQDWSLLPVTPPVSGHPSQIGQPQTGSSSVGAVLPVDGDRSLPDLLGHALSDAAWMLFASSAMRANLHSFLSPELILSSQRTGQIRLSWRRATERVAVSCGLLWGTIYMCFPCSLPPAKAQKVCWAYLKVSSLRTHSDTSSLLRAGRQAAAQKAGQSSVCPAPISSWNGALWFVSSCQQTQILFALFCKAFPAPLSHAPSSVPFASCPSWLSAPGTQTFTTWKPNTLHPISLSASLKASAAFQAD